MPEAAQGAVEGHLVDAATGTRVRPAAGVARDARVPAAARSDDVEIGAGVGVPREAAMLGRRADGEDLLGPRGIGEAAHALVARRADHQHALAAGVAQRSEDVRNLGARDLRAELEREVDDVGAAARGPADARRDRDAVALADP